MAGRTGAYMTGQDRVAAKLRHLAERFGNRVPGALFRRGEAIMADSKANYVPVDLGTLKNTGTVHPPERKGRSVTVTMTYGGPAVAYALAIHEHPSKHSPPSWQGVQVRFSPAGHGPKYLERPLLAAIPSMPQDIASDLALDSI